MRRPPHPRACTPKTCAQPDSTFRFHQRPNRPNPLSYKLRSHGGQRNEPNQAKSHTAPPNHPSTGTRNASPIPAVNPHDPSRTWQTGVSCRHRRGRRHGPLLPAAGRRAGAGEDDKALEQGGGQGVRGRAGGLPGAGPRPLGPRRRGAPRPHPARRLGPLPGARRRRRPHRARRRRHPQLLGRRRRRRPLGRGRHHRPPRRQAPRRGAPPRHTLVRGGAQAVPRRAGQVRAGRLAEHLALRGEDADADAGGQPRAEVLHPPGKRRHQGLQAQEHPRHHNTLIDRQPPTDDGDPLHCLISPTTSLLP